MVNEAIEAVLDEAARWPRNSPEWEALCTEATGLGITRDQVRRLPPGKREAHQSHLNAKYVPASMNVSGDVHEKVGEVYAIYREWANRPEWATE